jgi:hypothetical protein
MKARRAGCPAGVVGRAWSAFERVPLSHTRGGAAGATGQLVGSGEGGGQ